MPNFLTHQQLADVLHAAQIFSPSSKSKFLEAISRRLDDEPTNKQVADTLVSCLLPTDARTNNKEIIMRRYNQYLSRDDWDERGLLRDGHSYRVKITLADSADEPHFVRDERIARDSRTSRTVHDGTSDTGTLWHRPGWRMTDATRWSPTPDANTDDRQAAYDSYHDDLINAYKNPFGDDDGPTGAGSKGPRRRRPLGADLPAQEFKEEFDPDEDIDIATKPHRRKKRAEEEDDDTEDSLVKFVDVPVRAARPGLAAATASDRRIKRTQDQHDAMMEQLYLADELEKREAWKNPT